MNTPDRFRTLPDSKFDAIVIGAGTGGLTAAALLARRGKKVLVLDQHTVAGGNATIFSRPGYEFDIGLHYLGGCHSGGLIPSILRAAGSEPIVFEEMDPNGFDTLLFPEFSFRIPKGIEVFRSRLIESFPKQRGGIDRYCLILYSLQRLLRGLANPMKTLWNIFSSPQLLRWANRSFGEFLQSCTSDLLLQAVLAGQHANYALPPSRASLLIGAGIAEHYLEGAYYPRGGGQIISDKLAAAIGEAGGKILLRSRVLKILVRKGKAVGVQFRNPYLGVQEVEGKYIISNADVKQTFLELVGEDNMPSKSLQRVRQWEMAPALFVAYLGVRKSVFEQNHFSTNYWIHSSYDHELQYRQVARGEFPEAPTVFVSIASVKDPTNKRLAPEGIYNLQLIAVAPSQPEAWAVQTEEGKNNRYRNQTLYKERKEIFGRRLIELTRRAFPNLPENIVYKEFASPLTHSRYTLSTGGTGYGIAATPKQFLFGRPGARTEIDGLLLCGASCRTGLGIAGVMMSGLLAASAILGPRLISEVLGN
ncbi:NAD(P)/FAD-dependent oxidoreductase [Methylacidiphilum caldifontis]|uniref:phytoene desaturase family protein n=1 Tax=Methylacidiphilum caldifontis TaxID=2795386 RepID=UPI001A8E3D11|nr:NAD(P)/FAD-dependent oxidoreductase [Methylacidiphilum caldifontis]QSR89200.1 NAD(P)/FAD-dependent oxidoreductase [Methylacidiphilum caldifontis]